MLIKKILILVCLLLLTSTFSIAETKNIPPQLRQMVKMEQLFHVMAESLPAEYKKKEERYLKEKSDMFYTRMESYLTIAMMQSSLAAVLYETKFISEDEYHKKAALTFGVLETIAVYHSKYTRDNSLPPLAKVAEFSTGIGYPMTEKQIFAALPEERVELANTAAIGAGTVLIGGAAAVTIDFDKLGDKIYSFFSSLGKDEQIASMSTVAAIPAKGIRKSVDDSGFKPAQMFSISGISETAIAQIEAIEEYVGKIEYMLIISAIEYAGEELANYLEGKSTQHAQTQNPCEHEPEIEECRDQSLAKEQKNFSRNIEPEDLGVKGNLEELTGSFSVKDGVATARINMIRGEIKNPFEVINNLSSTARASGANTLRIEGTIANERLHRVLSQRYGMVSKGARDVVVIPLK